MKLRKYLTEDEDIYKVRLLLERDCKPFLKDFKKSRIIVYRGYNRELDSGIDPFDILKKKVRKNRKPRLVGDDLHKRLGKLSKKLFGWNVRAEGLFTTCSDELARRYGVTSAVFPIGKFECVWINDVSLLYKSYDHYAGSSNIKNTGKHFLRGELEEVIEEVEEVWEEIKEIYENDYVKNQLLKALKKEADEIIFKCNEYYLVSLGVVREIYDR